ncbi:hypothetical protein FKP32DRAFT_84392 [Trametes sanguinea]|nr:hypothetical protein FKP32DRAFT_84392 [Trametes sanguinea]
MCWSWLRLPESVFGPLGFTLAADGPQLVQRMVRPSIAKSSKRRKLTSNLGTEVLTGEPVTAGCQFTPRRLCLVAVLAALPLLNSYTDRKKPGGSTLEPDGWFMSWVAHCSYSELARCGGICAQRCNFDAEGIGAEDVNEWVKEAEVKSITNR